MSYHESVDPLGVANTCRSFYTNLYWRLMRKDGLGQRVEVKTHCNWEKVKEKSLYLKGEGRNRSTSRPLYQYYERSPTTGPGTLPIKTL